MCEKSSVRVAKSRRIVPLDDFLFHSQTSVLWPLPREFGRREGSEPVAFDIGSITCPTCSYYEGTKTLTWLMEQIGEQTGWLELKKRGSPDLENPPEPSTTSVQIAFELTASSQTPEITKDTDEAYGLTIDMPADDVIHVTINSADYFGARHALETLFQARDPFKRGNIAAPLIINCPLPL